MKLSTRSRYGVRAMFDLAAQQDTAPVAVRAIAERQGLSDSYLEQLMAPLRRAGLVQSVRGAQGGYALTRRPEEITVLDIVEVLEGPIGPTDCVVESAIEFEHCGRPEGCVTRRIWAKVRDRIKDALAEITLADLLQDAAGLPRQ